MAIDPLQNNNLSPLPRQQNHPSGGVRGAFQELLAGISEGGEAAAAKAQAAAELLRVAMLHNSLAIAGEDAEVPGFTGGSLDMLAGIARYAEAAPAPPAACAPGTITRTASHFLGVPYRFGGETSSGIDCSSFVQQVYREHNIELPRTAREQIQMGTEVAPGELREGDLVFFRTYASFPSHVGIYLGNGKMMHASSQEGKVTVSEVNSEYFRSRYLGAKRVV